MSDKPLAERWRKKEKSMVWGASYYASNECAEQLEAFVREHLTEQTEPSAEDWILARTWNHGVTHITEPHRCSRCIGLAEMLLFARNAERRRIRELLVGKETK